MVYLSLVIQLYFNHIAFLKSGKLEELKLNKQEFRNVTLESNRLMT